MPAAQSSPRYIIAVLRLALAISVLWAAPVGADFKEVRKYCELLLRLPPRPLESSKREALVAEADALMYSLNTFWRAEFEKRGLPFKPAQIKLFDKYTFGPCGFVSYRELPIYCHGDESIYLSLHSWEALEFMLNVHGAGTRAFVLGHEFGHHVQHVSGILAQADRAGHLGLNDFLFSVDVMMELQANAFSAYWMAEKNKSEPGKFNIAEARATTLAEGRRYFEMGPLHSGTVAQRKEWFEKGLNAKSPADLDPYRDPSLRAKVPSHRHSRLDEIFDFKN